MIQLTPVKFILEYDIYNEDGKLINIGTTTLAWADSKTFRIINIKKTHPEMYKKLESLVERQNQ